MVQQQHSINTAHNTFLFLAGLKKLWTNASNLLLNTPSNSLLYFSVRSELLDLQTKPRATRERQWTTTNCLDMKDRVPIWKHVGTGYVRTIIKPRKKNPFNYWCALRIETDRYSLKSALKATNIAGIFTNPNYTQPFVVGRGKHRSARDGQLSRR